MPLRRPGSNALSYRKLSVADYLEYLRTFILFGVIMGVIGGVAGYLAAPAAAPLFFYWLVAAVLLGAVMATGKYLLDAGRARAHDLVRSQRQSGGLLALMRTAPAPTHLGLASAVGSIMARAAGAPAVIHLGLLGIAVLLLLFARWRGHPST